MYLVMYLLHTSLGPYLNPGKGDSATDLGPLCLLLCLLLLIPRHISYFISLLLTPSAPLIAHQV